MLFVEKARSGTVMVGWHSWHLLFRLPTLCEL